MRFNNTPSTTRSSQAGLTLIELMIVVVIVAILAAITIPSYQNYLRTGAQGLAQTHLTEAASSLERWRADNGGTYVSAGSCNCFPQQSPRSGEAKYTIVIAVDADNLGYTLTATPSAAQGTAATDTLTLNEAGIRGGDWIK